MAKLEKKIFVEMEKRPCTVNGKNALFHRWSERAEIVEPAFARGGHSGGAMKWTVAIIEYEDGQVSEALPSSIKFLDPPHDEYFEREDEEI